MFTYNLQEKRQNEKFNLMYRVQNSNCSAYKIAHKLSKIQDLAKKNFM